MGKENLVISELEMKINTRKERKTKDNRNKTKQTSSPNTIKRNLPKP